MRRSQIPGGLGAWINWQQPTPIVPLERTVEAPERVSIQGDIVRPLDREAFRASLKELKREKPEAISVSLLNSFANNAHEEGIREVLKEEFGPDVEVVTSAEILPEIQEVNQVLSLHFQELTGDSTSARSPQQPTQLSNPLSRDT